MKTYNDRPGLPIINDFVTAHEPGRCPVMEGSSFGVDQTPFAEVIHVFELVAVKAPRNVDAFAPKIEQ